MASASSEPLERLSSLKFTLISLIVLISWLGLGVYLGLTKALAPHFLRMNQMLLLDWMLGPAWEEPLTPIWFLLLCLGVGVMLLNLGACTLTRLLPRLRSATRFKGWLLTLVHLVMLLVLLGHGAEMVMGHKREDVRLEVGRSVELPGGARLELNAVSYVDDKDLLNFPYRKSRWRLTREAFRAQDNFIDIAVKEPDGEVVSGRLRIMEPFCVDGLRLTLTDFNRIGEGAQAEVGAIMAVTNNPLTTMFFVAYAAWVALYLLLAMATWRGSPSPPATNGTGQAA